MSKTKKYLYIGLGTLFLLLGLLGIILPIIPTTPFLLLTAFFYARSSQILYNWLLEHKVLGKYIKQFKKGQGIPIRAKVTILSLLWITGLFSIYVVPLMAVKILLVVVFLSVSYYILSIKTLHTK